jgi:hypothetical protein
MFNKLVIPVPAVRSHIMPSGGLRPLIRSWSRDTAFSLGPLQNLSPSLRLSAVLAVKMLNKTSSRARSMSSNSSLDEITNSFGCLGKGVEKDRTNTIALNFRVCTIKPRFRIVTNAHEIMREVELEGSKMANITDPLRVMQRMSEVEEIHDGPFLLDLKIVVVEKAQDLFLDLHAIRIK